MPAVAEMTFLSRVIKENKLKEWSVSNLNYEALHEAPRKMDGDPPAPPGGFTPLFYKDNLDMKSGMGGGSSEAGGPGGHPGGDIPEGMLYIAEDELQRQLADAYLRGTEEGRQVAERGLSNVFRAIREGADSLVALREKVLRKSEGDLLKLACLVAKKIILQEIRQDQAILAKIVAATVNCCTGREKITIKLNPVDYQTVMDNQQMLAESVGDGNRVTLAPDSTVMPGGCLVETPTGTVDARIEAQLEEVFNRCMEESGIPHGATIGMENGEQVT